MSALRARCQDARVLNDKEDDRVSFVGCGICGMWDMWAPTIAFLRFFTPNPFSRNGNWTFINVHFWKS